MALAIFLIVMVVGSVIFHLWSQFFVDAFWFTPLASNWVWMDNTIIITFWLTGAAFIAVNLFLAYCVVKFRHSPQRRAAYEPENAKLEKWLTVLTSIGVVAMLAPGLIVYNNFIQVPKEAVIFEALGQQWSWSYRLPGADGALGKADNRHVSLDNPMGVDPDDPFGQDDIIVLGEPAHIQVDQPIKFNLRSKDVLHNLYVPQWRAKMDAVPGLVSYFWLTPTETGHFEVLCAELCGVGHYNMRSAIVVDTKADYDAWLANRKTFAESPTGGSRGAQAGGNPLVARGKELSQQMGCVACHSVDGSRGVGPSWQGVYGRASTLADGTTITADDAYLKESITAPNAKLLQGYPPVMAAYPMGADDLDAFIAYFKTLSE